MKIYWILLAGLIVLAASAKGSAFDREAYHAERLGVVQERNSMAMESAASVGVLAAAGSDDLLISEAVGPARFWQDHASVVALTDSRWLVAWADKREGRSKIFLQEINSAGSPVGSNLIIAGSSTGADLVDPKLAIDSNGILYLFYRDQTNGLIWGGSFDDNLQPITAISVINDAGDSFAGPYDFDAYPGGRLVVAWEEHALEVPAVIVKLLDSIGVTIAGPTVADESSGSNTWVPTVAIDPAGGFLVAWEDYRRGTADIFVQLFTVHGTKNGVNFMVVPPSANGASQFAPQAICIREQMYAVGWIDQRDGQQVYAQRVAVHTGLTGDNVALSSHDSETMEWDLDFEDAPAEALVATWASFGPENLIVSITLDDEMVPTGPSRRLDDALAGQRWAPAVSCNSDGRRLTVWTEVTDSDPDIAAMLSDSTGLPLLPAHQVLNDDTTGAPSTDPTVVPTTDWYNLVCFVDGRQDAGDIYIQMVSNFGSKLGTNIRVNQDSGPNLQSEPAVAASLDKALVIWVDNRAVNTIPGQRIFGRFCSPLGQFTEAEFMISSSTESAVKSSPRVVMSPDGRGLVAWIDHRLGSGQVFGRWLDDNGSFSGVEFLVSDTLEDNAIARLQLGVDSSGHTYLMWLDNSVLPSRLRVKWFNSDRTPGGQFSWLGSSSGVGMEDMAASVTASGSIVILFTAGDTDRQLFFSVRARDGSVVLPVTTVTDNVSAQPTNPAVAVSNNDHLAFTWVDCRNGRRSIFYRVFDNSFAPMEPSQAVSDVVTDYMASPAVSAFNGRAWITWVDPRQNGPGVYASAVVYQSLSIDDPIDRSMPNDYQLAQNYPNPFNPSTEISFTLKSAAEVTLTVYNLMGQQVSRLAEGQYPAGTHTVSWNSTDRSGSRVASGVYLYRLQSNQFSETRKMVLLK